jgi:GAF domain-containing protein
MAERREQLVMDTFIDLADTLASDYEVGEFLHLLVVRCGEVLEMSTAGVVLESANGTLRLAAATSDAMATLEEAEIDHREGPCLDAYGDASQVSADDLTADFGRWPNIAPLAVDMGLLAVHAFPLSLRDDCIGALNLYRATPGDFERDDIRLAQAFADVAAIGILQRRKVAAAEERTEQLQHALDSRIIIEQAKGVLSERAGISPDEAFLRIRGYARSHSERLRRVCERILDSEFAAE